jgi:hypothetical protein
MKTKNNAFSVLRLPFPVCRSLPLAVLLIALAIATGCKIETPPYAASTQTWTFGEQIWSDAIQCPECDKKETYGESDTLPKCHSDSAAVIGTYYSYNMPYVVANQTKMCPDPWRIPSGSDLYYLYITYRGVRTFDYYNWITRGGSEYTRPSAPYDSVFVNGAYWTTLGQHIDILGFWNAEEPWVMFPFSLTDFSLQVRCVRDK